jgi:FkbM family methyltransferase
MVAFAMSRVGRGLQIGERLLGRRRLWRLGRLIYAYSRRDLPEALAVDAEHGVLRRLAAGHARDRQWTVFDVGAFRGRWSLALLDHRPGSRIFAFEPTAASREILRQTLADRVEVIPKAVSDHVGEAAFVVHGQAGEVNMDGVNRLAVDGVGETVPVTTLDAFCAERDLGVVDVVKIDAEGHDLAVLRGAKALLSKGRIGCVQFEYNHHWLQTRSQLRDVFALAEGTRYAVGKIVPEGVELYDGWHPEMERFFQADYALLRDDVAALIGVRGRYDGANTYA